jgi:hypothetical protein
MVYCWAPSASTRVPGKLMCPTTHDLVVSLQRRKTKMEPRASIGRPAGFLTYAMTLWTGGDGMQPGRSTPHVSENCSMHECFPISVWWVMRLCVSEQLLYAHRISRIKHVRRHRCTGIIDHGLRLHEGLPCDDAKASAH